MEIPKWSGESYRFFNYRVRVFWFRFFFAATLLAAGFFLSSALQSFGWTVVDNSPTKSIAKKKTTRLLEPKFVGPVDIVGLPERPVSALSLRSLGILRETRSTFDLDAVPFNQFIDILREKSGLNFVISASARELIEGESLEVTFRTTVNAKRSLESALELALLGHDLRYKIRNGLVSIETLEECSDPLLFHSYDISELLYLAAKRRHDLSDACAEEAACCVGDEESETANFEDETEGCSCGGLSGEILIEFLEKSSSRLVEEEGSLEVTQGLLLVRKSYEVHKFIERTLRVLVAGLKQKGSAEDIPIVHARSLTPEDIDMERRLAREVNVHFNETPLKDVLDFLRDISGLQIHASPDCDLEESHLTIKASNIPLRTLIDLVLKDCQLLSYQDHGALIICSSDYAYKAKNFLVDFYPVNDLLQVRPGTEPLEAEYLEEILRNSTGEDEWEEPAQIEIIFGQIYVFQSFDVHVGIRTTLQALRAAKNR